MFRGLKRRQQLALVQKRVEALLLAAEPGQTQSTAEIIEEGWGCRPQDRINHYDLYYDVKSTLKRLQDIGLAEVRQVSGQPKRWLASEEARALQMHQNLDTSLAA